MNVVQILPRIVNKPRVLIEQHFSCSVFILRVGHCELAVLLLLKEQLNVAILVD